MSKGLSLKEKVKQGKMSAKDALNKLTKSIDDVNDLPRVKTAKWLARRLDN